MNLRLNSIFNLPKDEGKNRKIGLNISVGKKGRLKC